MVQRKRSFLTFAKENQSPLGLYRNPLTFLFSNPRFVLLIRDWCFVLLSPLRFHIHHFSLVRKLHIRPLLSARKVLSREHVYDSKQKLQITVYSVVNIYIFLAKMLWFTTGGLCSPHWAVWGTFLLWMDALYWTSFWLSNENSHPLSLQSLEEPGHFFNITPIGFIWQ